MNNTKQARMAIRRFFTPLLSIFIFIVIGINAATAQTTETIASGSFIINMGQTPQTVNNGLKPYGLLYDLLKNYSVPIKWVINTTKGKDGVDFTHNGINYAGGTFIIPAGNRTAAVNARITFWQGQGVVGATSVAPLTLPVYRTITAAPRWTLDKTNGAIVTQFFTAAGIPATAHGGSSSAGWKLPSQLNSCDDVFALPHADPTWAVHNNLLTWNSTYKGAIWTGCHAVSSLENTYNPANTSQQMNFLTQKVTTAGSQITLPVNGSTNYAQNTLVLWGNHDPGTPAYLTNVGGPQSGTIAPPSDPVSQFMGKPDGATQNGSEQIFVPVKGGGWLPSTKIITWDDSPPAKNTAIGINPSVVIAYGRAFGDNNRGLVMYSGGHDNNKGAVQDAVAIRRSFFNFAFLAMQDKIVNPTLNGISNGSVVTPGVPIAFSVTVPAPATLAGYTFQWTSTCGGTFAPSTTASSVTFTPAAVVGSVPCNISVKITDPCGRESFDTKSITVTCALTVGTTLVQPCGAGSNGSISMTISGGSAPYTYTWTRTEGGSGNGTGTTISGLAAGTYSVTVTAANGCASTFTRTLTTAPAIIVTATPSAVLCNGGATGGISTTVSGGSPGYTYLWTGGITTPNRSNLAAGTYNLTVTDTRGCTGTASATVTQPAVISATPTITQANCFGQASGTITLVVAGGTAPYTFLWNDGVTTQNRTSLAAGTYSVVISDSRGCTLAVNSLAVTQPAAALSLSTSVVNVACNGINNGSATVTPTGGTSPYAYNWNGTPTGDGTATITGLAAGSYPVTVTDNRGCTAVAIATITETSPLTVTADFVRPTCPPGVATLGNDGSITLTVAGGTAPRTYAWTASGGGIVPGGQSANQNLTLLVAGTYTVTVTDANNCTKTTSVTLTNINPNPATPGGIKTN
jgi:SprB repeat